MVENGKKENGMENCSTNVVVIYPENGSAVQNEVCRILLFLRFNLSENMRLNVTVLPRHATLSV